MQRQEPGVAAGLVVELRRVDGSGRAHDARCARCAGRSRGPGAPGAPVIPCWFQVSSLYPLAHLPLRFARLSAPVLGAAHAFTVAGFAAAATAAAPPPNATARATPEAVTENHRPYRERPYREPLIMATPPAGTSGRRKGRRGRSPLGRNLVPPSCAARSSRSLAQELGEVLAQRLPQPGQCPHAPCPYGCLADLQQ